MSRDRAVTEVRTTDDGRWVLGDPNTRCPSCKAPAAVHYASNGKAEVWHAPTDCCDYAHARERRFDRMRQEADDRAYRAEQTAQANAYRTAA